MAKTTQKLVLSFDRETQSYKSIGHNLNTEQALEQAQKLQSEGLHAVVVNQDRAHRTLSSHQCNPCKEAADHAQASGPPISDEESTEAAAAEESESE